jgi:hypothetical protein
MEEKEKDLYRHQQALTIYHLVRILLLLPLQLPNENAEPKRTSDTANRKYLCLLISNPHKLTHPLQGIKPDYQ